MSTMSSYATAFEHSDAAGDEVYINEDLNQQWPLMVSIRNGAWETGVELYREDVRKLINFLSDVERRVPLRGN